MNTQRRHIFVFTGIMGMLAISGCDNQNGIGGAESIRRAQFGNTAALSPAFEGQTIAYLSTVAYGSATPTIPNNGVAGGIATTTTPGITPAVTPGVPAPGGAGGIAGAPGATPTAPTTIAGGIAGPAGNTTGNVCYLNVVTLSNAIYSPTNYGLYSQQAGLSGISQGFYPGGNQAQIFCSPDSKIAATKTTFYVTGGSLNGNLYAIHVHPTTGAIISSDLPRSVGPTKDIAADATGHVALVLHSGQLKLFEESSVDSIGRWTLNEVFVRQPPGSLATDVAISGARGALFVARAYGVMGSGNVPVSSGVGAVSIYDLNAAFGGFLYPYYETNAPLTQYQSNLSFVPYQDGSFSTYLSRMAVPTDLVAFDGVAGFLTNGAPVIMEPEYVLDSVHADQMPQDAEAAEDYIRQNAKVGNIYVYNPFQLQGNFLPTVKSSDIAIVQTGLDYFMYGFIGSSLFSCHIDKDDPYSCANPPQLPVGVMVGQPSIIKTDYHGDSILIAGSSGINIASVDGGIIFANPTSALIPNTGIIDAAFLQRPRLVVSSTPAKVATPAEPAPEEK